MRGQRLFRRNNLSDIDGSAQRRDHMRNEVKSGASNGSPRRIQRKRTRGWRLPPNTVCVSRPSKWGNPFRVTDERTASECVHAFRIWLTVKHCHAGIPERKQWMLEHLHELRGKHLACWCRPGAPCHADVLLELANKEISRNSLDNDD